jgi:zinc protease
MNRSVLAAASVLVLASAALAQPSPSTAVAPPIVFTQRTLANGLKVYASVDKTTPDVTVQVFYGVGSKDDPPGRSGFAHLFEHLMFKGSRDMPPEFMDRLTEDVGGENNASTWDDFTEFHEVIPANHLQRLLWAEAERMSSLVVDDANFKSERQVVEEELRQRVLADPYGRLFALALPQASFAVHPYHRPGIGSIEDLDAASLSDVRAFHTTYYRPDDASLIVVGNFDPKDLDSWVDQYFAPIPTPARPIPRVSAVEPPRTGPGTYDAYGPNVPLPALAITWLAPAKGSPDAAALDVAETILGSGDSSRLNLDLVHDQQLASQVFAEADLKQQPGAFEIGAVLAGGRTLEQGEAALRAEVARLRHAPVSPEELSRAKNQLLAEAVRGRETVEGRGQVLGFAIGFEGDAQRANDVIAKLQAVTAADVQRVARQYLPDDRRMVIRYQADSARPAGQAAAAPPALPMGPSVLAPDDATPATLAPESQRQAPPPPGPPVAAVLPTPVERTLPNGLRVIVAKSTALPMVTAELTVRSGAAADPAGKAGLAQLTASLLNKGAGRRSAAEVARDIEALGGSLEESAGWDGSRITLNVLAAELDKAAPILADVVRRPTLSQDELQRLRRQSLDDLKVNLQDPGELGRYAAAVAVFAGTPYGHVLDGTPSSLARITRQDVQAFHAAHYRPDQAILVLTGDIEPEQGFALAGKAFGDWRKPAAPAPKPAVGTPRTRPQVVVIDLPGTGQASVGLAMPAIARKDARFFDAIVANATLGGGYSARLNQEIRIKRGLSYGAGSAIDARREIGPFVARAQTRNDATPEVAGLLLDQVRALGAAPAGKDEIDARKATLTGSYGRDLETTQGLADTLSNYALQGVPLGEIARYDRDVRAVTPEAAQRFAAQTLDPSKASVIVVGDAKSFIGPLKAKFPDLRLIEAGQLDLDSPTLKKAPGRAKRR